MKTKFSWAWDSQTPTSDPLMNRSRAARLLQAWRRDRQMLVKVKRAEFVHSYHVEDKDGYGALMVIQTVSAD